MADTVIAALGVVLAALALFRGWLTDKRTARDAEETHRLRQGIAGLQAQMVDALQRIAEAQEQASGMAGANIPAGMLSARIQRTRSSHELVVKNIGEGAVEVTDVQVLKHPEVVVVGAQSPRGRTLMPGEELTMMLALSAATPPSLDVLLAWRDSGGSKERVQTVDS